MNQTSLTFQFVQAGQRREESSVSALSLSHTRKKPEFYPLLICLPLHLLFLSLSSTLLSSSPLSSLCSCWFMSSFINSPCGIWMTEDTNRKTLRISLKATNCHLKHLFHFHRRDFFLKQNQRQLKSVYQSLKLRLIYPDVKKKHVLLFLSYNKTFKFSLIDNTFNSVQFYLYSTKSEQSHQTQRKTITWPAMSEHSGDSGEDKPPLNRKKPLRCQSVLHARFQTDEMKYVTNTLNNLIKIDTVWKDILIKQKSLELKV